MTLHSALVLNGPQQGQSLSDDDEIVAALREPQLAWLHLQADDPDTRPWIESHLSYLDPVALSALLQDETRPRAVAVEDGAMIILRGVNTNAGENPEDMVSLRLWIDQCRIVSLSRRPLASVQQLQDEIRAGKGPVDAGRFLCRLIDLLNLRIEDILHSLEERVDFLESDVLDEPDQELRQGITDARQDVILFRRYLAPQRDALGYLVRVERPVFMTKGDTRRMAEAHDRLVRVVEELDEFRDRLAVIKDELANLLSDHVNRNLYVLSIISLIFLPLGFLTGLLGINVGGMPGVSDGMAFWIVCGLCLGVVGIVLLVLRRLKWI